MKKEWRYMCSLQERHDSLQRPHIDKVFCVALLCRDEKDKEWWKILTCSHETICFRYFIRIWCHFTQQKMYRRKIWNSKFKIVHLILNVLGLISGQSNQFMHVEGFSLPEKRHCNIHVIQLLICFTCYHLSVLLQHLCVNKWPRAAPFQPTSLVA